MPSRGWIVPVGGSTPDRLKVGAQPSTGKLHPRQIFPRNSEFGEAFSALNFLILVFCRPPNALAWVDRSGRGYNPRPARRPAQLDRRGGVGVFADELVGEAHFFDRFRRVGEGVGGAVAQGGVHFV